MLNEMQHAFIVASYYRRIIKRDPRLGEEVFLFCTRKYAEERGSRMAQRALRDGHSLDLAAYMAYGEWDYTSPDIVENEVLATEPHHHYLVKKCPWNTQFKAMAEMNCAESYCADLDRSLARGFNPDCEMEVRSTMHSKGQCEFILHGAGAHPRPESNAENKRPFGFHCGHVHSTFARCVKNIYGADGEAMKTETEADFEKEFGSEALAELREYSKSDFLSIDS